MHQVMSDAVAPDVSTSGMQWGQDFGGWNGRLCSPVAGSVEAAIGPAGAGCSSGVRPLIDGRTTATTEVQAADAAHWSALCWSGWWGTWETPCSAWPSPVMQAACGT